MTEFNDISELKAENTRLKAELEKAREKELDSEESSAATLYMLEDLERSLDEVARGKKEWEATFDAISDPLFIHDKEMRLVRVNRAYLTASGEAKFKNIIGRPYYEVFPKMDGPFKMCLKALELREEEVEEVSLAYLQKVFKVRFYPRNENGGILYSIHILEDITEAKRAEERIKEEMEVTTNLLMLAEATAHTTDIDRLMEQVASLCHRITGCDIHLNYLWDKETKVFKPSQVYGLSHELVPLFKTETLHEDTPFLKAALTAKEPVIEQWEVPYKFEKELQWIEGVRGMAVTPLIGKEGYLGLIITFFKKPVEITEKRKRILKGFSYQVSTALEQARLYKESVDKTLELSHKIETIRVMNEIDRSILSTLNADELLETVTRLISKVIPCDRATVSLVDMERGGIIYKAGFGTAAVSKSDFVSFADTSAKVVFETGRAEYVNNLSEMTPLLPLEKRFFEEGFLSQISVPITIKGDVAGILTVGAKRVAAFTKENLSTLEYLCSQIGVALSNAGLISDLEELFIGVVKSLSSAIDAKSPWTAGHSERVTKGSTTNK